MLVSRSMLKSSQVEAICSEMYDEDVSWLLGSECPDHIINIKML